MDKYSKETNLVIESKSFADRTQKIDTICIMVHPKLHSAEQIASVYSGATMRASANYIIDSKGVIVGIVPDEKRAFGSHNQKNDNRSILIRVAAVPVWGYPVHEEALKALVRLVSDLCLRHGIPKLLWHNDQSLIGKPQSQNITISRWFSNRICPGDALLSFLPILVRQVNRIIDPELMGKLNTVEQKYGLSDTEVEILSTNPSLLAKISRVDNRDSL